MKEARFWEIWMRSSGERSFREVGCVDIVLFFVDLVMLLLSMLSMLLMLLQ